MRIAHLDTERTWRGGEVQTLRLAAGLAARGHEVCLVTPPDAELARRGAAAGMVVHPVPMHGPWDLRAAWTLAGILKRERIDVLHMQTAHALSLGALATCKTPVPARVMTRRVDFPPSRHWIARQRYRRGVDAVACVCEAVRNVMLEAGLPEEKLTTIYSAVDREAFAANIDRGALRNELGLAPDTPLIVSVGALVDHKSQWYLIDSLPIVHEVFPGAHLALAGEGEMRPRLEAQIERLNLSDKVHLLGHRDDVPNVLGAATVYAVSSHSEGICGTLLEAMAAGVPVVGTRAGGIPEVIDHGSNGYLVPPRDPPALAAAICLLLDDGPLRARMIEKGYEQLDTKFSVDTMVERYLALYERLLQRDD